MSEKPVIETAWVLIGPAKEVFVRTANTLREDCRTEAVDTLRKTFLGKDNTPAWATNKWIWRRMYQAGYRIKTMHYTVDE